MLLMEIFKSLREPLIMNPWEVETLGKNNIQTYRDKIDQIFKSSGISTTTKYIVFQVTAEMKNYNKLMEALKFAKEEVKNHPNYGELMMFLEKWCCATTRDQTNKIPVVKIPDSYPEICSAIHLMHCAIKAGSNVTAASVAVSIVAKSWSGSLFYDSATQEINKESTKAQWDSWGMTGGKKLNYKGEKLEFSDDIYANQAADRIKLWDTDLSEYPTVTGYSMDDMTAWAQKWLDMFENTPLAISYRTTTAIVPVNPSAIVS